MRGRFSFGAFCACRGRLLHGEPKVRAAGGAGLVHGDVTAVSGRDRVHVLEPSAAVRRLAHRTASVFHASTRVSRLPYFRFSMSRRLPRCRPYEPMLTIRSPDRTMCESSSAVHE